MSAAPTPAGPGSGPNASPNAGPNIGLENDTDSAPGSGPGSALGSAPDSASGNALKNTSIVRGSLVSLGVRLLDLPSRYGFHLLIAAMLGVVETGNFYIVFSTMVALAGFGRLGIDQALTRQIAMDVASGRAAAVRPTIRRALAIVLLASVAVSVLLGAGAFAFADHVLKKPALAWPLVLGALSFVPQNLGAALAGALAGLQRVGFSQMIYSWLWPAIFCAAAIPLGLAGGMTVANTLVLIAASFALTALAGAWLLKRFLRELATGGSGGSGESGEIGGSGSGEIGVSGGIGRSGVSGVSGVSGGIGASGESGESGIGASGASGEAGAPALEAAHLLKPGLPLFTLEFTKLLITSAPAIVLGIVASSRETGLFALAWRLALVVNLLISGVTGMAAPKFASLHARRDREGLERSAAQAIGIVVALALPATLCMLLFPERLLALFGPGYGSGAAALRVLAIGQIAAACFTAMPELLGMTAHTSVLYRINVCSVAVLLVGLAVLAPFGGSVGAAVAASLAIAVNGAMAAWAAHRLLGVLPLRALWLSAMARVKPRA